MPNRLPRWGPPLLIALVAGLGMIAISLLSGMQPPPAAMAVSVHNIADVTSHPVPPGVHPASTYKAPSAIWLVRNGTGWIALGNQSPHPRDWTVVWDPAANRFIDPFIGSVFDRTGLNVAGPAPRGLDSYPVTVRPNEIVEIDLAHPTPVTH